MTDRDRETDRQAEEDAHPLAQPTELAGTAEEAIAAEFAARDAIATAEGREPPLDGE